MARQFGTRYTPQTGQPITSGRRANNLAAILTVREKNDEALAMLKRVVATRQKLYPEGSPFIVDSLNSLQRLLIKLHRFDEAEITGREALAAARKVRGDTHQDVLDVLQDLVTALLGQHKSEAIEPLFADLLPADWEGKPQYAGLLLSRCEAYARCSRWRDSVRDATVLLEHSPDNHEYYHTLIPLLVQLDDLPQYQKLCRTILDKFSGTTNVVVADRMAKDCLLLPSSGVDPASAAALADVAVSHGSNPNASPYFKACKALAEFRMGHYEEAITWAQRATQGQELNPKAWAAAVLAMSQFKLGQPDNARVDLIDCNKMIEQQLPQPELDLTTDWRDWIIAHALQSEAKQMIR